MRKKQKVIIIMPAYNSAKTVEMVLKKIPKGYYDEIILVDDASFDNTFTVSKKLGIESYSNPINLGYGGNLKMCLIKALEQGADVIIELHPDNEYDPSAIPSALEKINCGIDFVLGNRFSSFTAPLKMGMPFWKYIPSRILSLFHRYVLGIPLSDVHQGFRVYTRRLLENINFTTNSNSYLFSFEIIAQAKFNNLSLSEVPVICNYVGRKRGASFKNSIIYTLGTFKVILLFLLVKAGVKHSLFISKKVNFPCTICERRYFLQEKCTTEDYVTRKKFTIYFCYFCQNSITYPIPKNLGNYYTSTYFDSNTFFGKVKEYIYLFFQRRRLVDIIAYKQRGDMLDVGSGEGHIGKLLEDKGFSYLGLEAPFATIKNKKIKKVDSLSYHSKKKYDIITFWESFEHVPSPKKFLIKARSLLKDDGVIILELPRFDSLESFLFGDRWYHLSPPRHLSHFTSQGIRRLLKLEGFEVKEQKSIFALEYAVWGFVQSFLNFFQRQNKTTDLLIRKKAIITKIFYVFPALILIPFAFLLELLFYIGGSSPIILCIASKKK